MLQEPTLKPQDNQKMNQNISMRDLQKQIGKRMNAQGKEIEKSRLSQEERPRQENQQINMPKKSSSSKKWMIGIIGGSVCAGGLAGWLI